MTYKPYLDQMETTLSEKIERKKLTDKLFKLESEEEKLARLDREYALKIAEMKMRIYEKERQRRLEDEYTLRTVKPKYGNY